MASEFALSQISEFFDKAYGKPIAPGSYDLWMRIFSDVPDGILTQASHWLIEHRDISRAVVPGEMAKAVAAVGGTVRRYSPENGFKDDPIVRALDSRSQADEGGISLHEWLEQEGLASCREAAEKYADPAIGAVGVVPVLEMAGVIATIAEKLKGKDLSWKDIAQTLDDEGGGG